MKKNPGRHNRRNLVKHNRDKVSGKKSVINERVMLWYSRYLAHKKLTLKQMAAIQSLV